MLYVLTTDTKLLLDGVVDVVDEMVKLVVKGVS
jgi:hypothetical protein